jgi:carboxylate-amine ligase
MDYDLLEQAPTPCSVGIVAPKAAQEFMFGIEEEYFLADAGDFSVSAKTPAALFDEAAALTGGGAVRECLQAQIEVRTAPHSSVAAMRDELTSLRGATAAAAAKFGLSIMASGTHPTADWAEIAQTPLERYEGVIDTLQIVGRRNMLCGMHVHVRCPTPRAGLS